MRRILGIAAWLALALAGCVHLDAGKGPFPDTYFDFPVRN